MSEVLYLHQTFINSVFWCKKSILVYLFRNCIIVSRIRFFVALCFFLSMICKSFWKISAFRVIRPFYFRPNLHSAFSFSANNCVVLLNFRPVLPLALCYNTMSKINADNLICWHARCNYKLWKVLWVYWVLRNFQWWTRYSWPYYFRPKIRFGLLINHPLYFLPNFLWPFLLSAFWYSAFRHRIMKVL